MTPFRQSIPLTPGSPVAQFEIGSMQNLVYLLIDWTSKSAWIMDPQSDLGPIDRALSSQSLSLKGVLLTHTHFDHIAGVPKLLERDPSLPIYVGERDVHRLQRKLASRKAQIRIVGDGDQLQLGTLIVQALHTPGHSPGEICWFVPGSTPILFTGDTVFIRDCGRTDLDGGDSRELFESLQRIRQLPGDTRILPGHHYQPEFFSTLAEELRTSAPFQCRTVEELEALP